MKNTPHGCPFCKCKAPTLTKSELKRYANLEFFSCKEASRLCGVNVRQVQRWASRKMIKYSVQSRGLNYQIKFTKADLLYFLKKRPKKFGYILELLSR